MYLPFQIWHFEFRPRSFPVFMFIDLFFLCVKKEKTRLIFRLRISESFFGLFCSFCNSFTLYMPPRCSYRNRNASCAPQRNQLQFCFVFFAKYNIRLQNTEQTEDSHVSFRIAIFICRRPRSSFFVLENSVWFLQQGWFIETNATNHFLQKK